MRSVIYRIRSKKVNKRLLIALVSDLHDKSADGIAKKIAELSPDMIAVSGDLTSRIDLAEGEFAKTDGLNVTHKIAFDLLSELSKIAPTYYSLGNHELCGHAYKKNFGLLPLDKNLRLVEKSGAVLLDDEFTMLGDIAVGGLTTGMVRPTLAPNLLWLSDFERAGDFRILLCHHPEYYEKYLRDRNIDLILAGHAHGGQIRLFGRGLYAPGQGILPRHAGGVYDGRLVVGRGLANTAPPIPRLFNPRELVFVEIKPDRVNNNLNKGE